MSLSLEELLSCLANLAADGQSVRVSISGLPLDVVDAVGGEGSQFPEAKVSSRLSVTEHRATKMAIATIAADRFDVCLISEQVDATAADIVAEAARMTAADAAAKKEAA